MSEPESPRNHNDRPLWHAKAVEETIESLGTDSRQGLSASSARKRLKEHGPNLLQEAVSVPWWKIFLRQFVDVLIGILLVAAVISFALGEIVDAIAILVIVVLNGILGFVQEWRAEKALEALQKMLSPSCTVVREGKQKRIDAEKLVPGDVVVLEVGDRVPGDLRLIEAADLRVDESSLTGESQSVEKNPDPVEEGAPLAERSSMVWMGTSVTNGRGRGVVVATGMETEFGRIAELTQTVGRESTPLQDRLTRIGKQLGIAGVSVSLIVGFVGWLAGKPLLEMFMTGISLAVAVVPESLPAVVTITLALGIRAMVRRRALLRRLQAAETLGSATVICTDKTGTLTRNEMTVQHIWLPEGRVRVTGLGYTPEGKFVVEGEEIDPASRKDLMALLASGLRCNNAKIEETDGEWEAIGEPTEAAIAVAALKAGIEVDPDRSIAAEISFSSGRKRMSVIEPREGGGYLAHVKGAPEVILDRSSHLLDGEQTRELTSEDREYVRRAQKELATQGLRVLAIARRELNESAELKADDIEKELTFLGLVGIIDPPREEVPEAIRLAERAGIRTIMITGDAAATAQAIAERLNLGKPRPVEGPEFEKMSDDELREALQGDVLFARVSPEHKLRIIEHLQDMGHVTAMTGDGVNDAPALKKAEIGIAMGIRGTDVAKGAADMVLTDDNFASIVGAIEEGRRQYDNIQKFIGSMLSSNSAEILAILLNILLGATIIAGEVPLILLPVQILWVNLVTDGLGAIALGVEPVEKGVMHRPPRPRDEPVITRRLLVTICAIGTYIGLVTLGVFQWYLKDPDLATRAQTMAFTTLVMMELVNVFNYRALHVPLWKIGFAGNPWVLVASLINLLLQLAVVYIPFLQKPFDTVFLTGFDWGIILAFNVPLIAVPEFIKWRQSRNRTFEESPQGA